MALRPYNDPDYRAAKAWLKVNPATRCWFHGCDAIATTIDHVPAISEHHHIRGTNCCQLKPACRPHNCGHGATIGNQARNIDRDAELAATARRWRG